ncbi:MAG: xanthine dehydrogenase family protein subunit M [Alphaproteobacteria bacterium]|nr:xanthine dehydrogenase family protein subunit M [Alphaproteobacteria bacterium]
MKAAEFAYARALSVADAVALLAAAAGEAKLIAGGQTLVPLMAMRLARPALLVDIDGIAELNGIAMVGDTLRIGAGTRQAEIERSGLVGREVRLLALAIGHVGHGQIRNRGTIGGSIAHGDPAAELPLVAVTLGATLLTETSAGAGEISARDFYLGPMTTTLPADALITRIDLPIWRGRVGAGFHEMSPRRGDFALAAAAAQVELDGRGRCRRAVIGVGGAAPTPIACADAARLLEGRTLDDTLIAAAASAAAALTEPASDSHGSAEYRRRLTAVLVARALKDAATMARAVP